MNRISPDKHWQAQLDTRLRAHAEANGADSGGDSLF
jgi:hypothetical protein